jgi:uncharacterized membrane protein YqaE (UPF0057 family)
MSLRYTSPWRPNYEARAVGLWLLLAAFAFASAGHWQLHRGAFHAFALVALLMALTWLPGALRLHAIRKNLNGRALAFVTAEQLARTMARFPASRRSSPTTCCGSVRRDSPMCLQRRLVPTGCTVWRRARTIWPCRCPRWKGTCWWSVPPAPARRGCSIC